MGICLTTTPIETDVKMVIWDLDDTFSNGTLAETVSRRSLRDPIRRFDQTGAAAFFHFLRQRTNCDHRPEIARSANVKSSLARRVQRSPDGVQKYFEHELIRYAA
jgi:hypothetical protein